MRYRRAVEHVTVLFNATLIVPQDDPQTKTRSAPA